MLEPGTVLGHYRILRILGRGGMGTVYEVEHLQVQKRYALKVLPRAVTMNPSSLDRFRVEARTLADMEHPHIVHVHYVGEESGTFYLVMDCVSGTGGDPRTLADELVSCGGKLPEERVREIALQLCEALEYAHAFREGGVVHGNLKPANILLEGSGGVRIADFGLARAVRTECLRSVIDRSLSSSVVGVPGGDRSLGEQAKEGGAGAQGAVQRSMRSLLETYEYMAPEQKTRGEVTVQTDIYALGLILYRLLTGRKAEGRFRTPSELGCSKGWDEAVLRCLAPEPGDRWPSVSSLNTVFASSGRQRWRLLGGTLLALVLCAGVAVWALGLLRPEPALVRTLPNGGGHTAADRTFDPEHTEAVLRQPWKIPDFGMEFVWIEALGMWVGKYEVTNSEYRVGRPDHDSGEYRGHSLNADRQPVVHVSFSDAREYAKWLTARERAAGRLPEGRVYRLPQASEWVVFAQCGDGRRYPWGHSWPPKYGNYMGEGTKEFPDIPVIEGYRDGSSVTCDVEKSGRNDWGLFGVGGNVWECTLNSLAEYGGWYGASWYCSSRDSLRCSDRCRMADPSFRVNRFGFRLVLSCPEE
jgi:tRNA A-37 threonylcarbamoyl transferase component Bud32